ncbi:hypothetical protein ALC60_09889 [Trachymyrmex zeteki]|uniref:Uncharacterized protein n=1 Tax=Mycetomoellerius zeteki TaxID=64791 RepID=A0A151WTH6_9HYME|nr:hypothetical protein ALC60_09889 [Trachymyrmex zeteki]
MKWTARFTKRWNSKNGSKHGEHPRNGKLSYRKHPGSLKKPQENCKIPLQGEDTC